jgi:Spy/CpxP family protein refolding chaperone
MVTTMTTRLLPFALLAIAGALGGCAKDRSNALPGDSVAADGGVTLSPPRLSTSPTEAREAREGLGPVESRLFPPELVMEHQGELGITDAQKQALLAETERGQSAMLRLQWELQAEKEKLVKLLDAERVDEAKVQKAAARVMDRETKVKASHLGMLVRVKNLLTHEQQAKLREIRAGARSVATTTTTDAGNDAKPGATP